jgi:hypothetical protein
LLAWLLSLLVLVLMLDATLSLDTVLVQLQLLSSLQASLAPLTRQGM